MRKIKEKYNKNNKEKYDPDTTPKYKNIKENYQSGGSIVGIILGIIWVIAIVMLCIYYKKMIPPYTSLGLWPVIISVLCIFPFAPLAFITIILCILYGIIWGKRTLALDYTNLA